MAATLEQPAPTTVTSRSVFILRFVSTIALWSIALAIAFSGYEILFWFLISAFGLIALWEFYGMLDHDRLPNFKITAMICGAIMLGAAFIISPIWGRRVRTILRSRSCSSFC